MIIIGNGRLVTREIGNSFYENGAVAADGEVIVKVGETEALKKEFPDLSKQSFRLLWQGMQEKKSIA